MGSLYSTEPVESADDVFGLGHFFDPDALNRLLTGNKPHAHVSQRTTIVGTYKSTDIRITRGI
jgi:hypothetical protein